MMILRGKYVVLSNRDFMSTRFASIHTGPRSHRSGILELVKRYVVALLHELGIFIQGHRELKSFWNLRFRLLDPFLEELHYLCRVRGFAAGRELAADFGL
jgi:hypothetical protein